MIGIGKLNDVLVARWRGSATIRRPGSGENVQSLVDGRPAGGVIPAQEIALLVLARDEDVEYPVTRGFAAGKHAPDRSVHPIVAADGKAFGVAHRVERMVAGVPRTRDLVLSRLELEDRRRP